MDHEYNAEIGHDKQFASFRSHILPCTNKVALLMCGSFNEQPLEYAMLNLTDLDIMSFDNTIIAVIEPAIIPKRFHGEILNIETNNCHTGFARLLRHREGKIEYFVRSRKNLHGPAVKRSLIRSVNVSKILSTASKNKATLKGFREFTADYVYSVLCPCWPTEADEWTTRKRYSGWPTKDMIEKIVADGCHLVPKSHQSNPNDDTTWRFSFSKAEFLLVTSWNEIQKYVYHILRHLKADVTAKCGGEKKTFLCTYFFKTLMLWACEEKPSNFWSQNQVEASVEELLLQMIEWLIERNCPNYFIRENNMIDYLPSDFDVSNEVSLLHTARQNISIVMALEPKVYRGKMIHIRMSEKVLLIGQLALNRRVFFNPMNQKSERYVVKDLSTNGSLVREVENLFRGLEMHRIIMSDMSSSEVEITKKRKTHEIDALKYFQISYRRKCNYKHFNVYISLMDSLPCAVDKFLNRASVEHSQRMCCYHRNEEGNFTSKAMEGLCQSVLSAVDRNHQDPSYFISAAYYANFYYTGLQNCRQALKICEEALTSFLIMEGVLSFDTLELSFSNEILCVFINREYIRIYDAGIQVVFGFLTLCVHIIKQISKHTSYQRSTNSDVVVQVCPVGFLAYIRIRCRNMLHLSEVDYFDAVNLFDYTANDTVFRNLSTATLSAAICVKDRHPHLSVSR